jgi:hypothetical protein
MILSLILALSFDATLASRRIPHSVTRYSSPKALRQAAAQKVSAGVPIGTAHEHSANAVDVRRNYT